MATTNRPYGDAVYADPGYQDDGKARYPIDTEEHARAALAYFSKPKNQQPYTASQIKTIMGRIKAACRRFGIGVSGDDRSTGASDVEYRVRPLGVECRSGADQRRIGGYAATFGSRSQLLGDFFEVVDPQFFNESRAQGWPNVVCRAEHDSRMLLGAVHSGTLQLAIDSRGLDYTCSLAAGRQDIYESIGRGDFSGSSFAFRCTDDDWDYRDGTPLRILRSGSLHDVGPVTVPAYRDTSTALRSLARCMDAPFEDVEMYSRSGELRRFFTRSHRPPPRRMSGAQALVHIKGRMWGYVPARSQRPMSGAAALAYIQGKRWGPELQRRTMSGALAKMLIMAKRPYDPIVPRGYVAGSTRDPRLALLRLRQKRIEAGW